MNIVDNTIKKLFAEPATGLGGISKLYDDVIKSEIDSWKIIEQKLNEHQKKLILALFDNKVILKPTAKDYKDHAVLKIVHDHLEHLVLDTIKPNLDVAIIGAVVKQVANFHASKKFRTVKGIYGNFGPQDKVRLADNLMWAKSARGLSKDVRRRETAASYLNFSEGRDSAQHQWHSQNPPKADVLVLIDSIYDITPKDLHKYFMLTGASVAYATMIACPELLNNEVSMQLPLDVMWTTDRNHAFMRHIQGKSLGYTHKLSNILKWNYRSVHQFGNKMLVCEVIYNLTTYLLMKINIVDACDTLLIRSLPISLTHVPIFDVKQYVNYRREVRSHVELPKLLKLIDYISRLVIEKTEPSTILTYVSAMRHKLIINQHEVESDFVINEVDLKLMIRFAIFYAILRKGDVFKTVGDAVNLSKNKKGKVRMFYLAKLAEIWDWVKRVDKRLLLTKMEECMRSNPDFVLEKTSIKKSKKLFIKAYVSNKEPKSYHIDDKTLLLPSVVLEKPKRAKSKSSSKINVVQQPQISSTQLVVSNSSDAIIPDLIEQQDLIVELIKLHEYYVECLEAQYDICSKIKSRTIEGNRGYVKAKQLDEMHDLCSHSQTLLEIGPFPGGSTKYFLEKGCNVIGIGPAHMTNSNANNTWFCKPTQHLDKSFQDLMEEDQSLLSHNYVWFSDASVTSGQSIENDDLVESILTNWEVSKSTLICIKIFSITKVVEYFLRKFVFFLSKPKASRQNPEVYLVFDKNLSFDHNDNVLSALDIIEDRIHHICCVHFYDCYHEMTGKSENMFFETALSLQEKDKGNLVSCKLLKRYNIPVDATIVEVGGGSNSTLLDYPNYINIDPKKDGKTLQDVKVLPKGDVLILSQSLHHLTNYEIEYIKEMLEKKSFTRVILKEHDVRNDCQKNSLQLLHWCYGENSIHNYTSFDDINSFMEKCGFYPGKINKKNWWTYETIFSDSSVKEYFTLSQKECISLFKSAVGEYLTSSVAKQYNNYQEMHKKIHDKLKIISVFPDYGKIKITLMHRVAGGGKTTLIHSEIKPGNGHLYVCHTGELLAQFRTRFEKDFPGARDIPAKTFEAALLYDQRVSCIHLDEAFTQPITYIIALMTVFKDSVIKLYGDPEQCNSRDDEHPIPAGSQLLEYVKYFTNINKSNQSFRIAENMCKYLREEEKYDIYSKITNPLKIFFNGALEKGLNICFSDATKNILKEKGIHSISVRQAQGQDVSHVNLFLTQYDCRNVQVPTLRKVALTRARNVLNIVDYDGTGVANKYFPHLHKIQAYAEIYSGLIPVIPNYHEKEIVKVLFDDKRPEIKFDAVALYKTFTNRLPENLQISAKPGTAPLTVTMTVDGMELIRKFDKESSRLVPTNFGKQFFVGSNHQTITTSIDRISKTAVQKGYQLTVSDFADDVRFVQNIKHVFIKEKFSLVVDQALEKFHQTVVLATEKWFNHTPNMGELEEDSRVAFEFLKQQVKPYLDQSKIYTGKNGQSIKAWTKTVNVAFAGLFKTLVELLRNSMKEKFIWANGLSDSDLASKLDSIGDFDGTIDLDATFMDGCHNDRTINIERLFWLVVMSGNVENAIKYYHMMRKGLKVIAKFYSYFKGAELDSGSVATLPANVFLSIFVTMILFPMDRCLGGTYLGDDSSLLWRNPIPKFEPKKVEKITKMELKMETNKHIYFCNKFYFGPYWCYNLQLLIYKVLQREYIKTNIKVDEKNFKEYQNGVYEILKPYQSETVRLMYAGLMKLPVHIVELQIDLLYAFTKMTWKELNRELNREIIFDV